MKPKFFATANAFRKWLEKNHQSKQELLVGYYKVNSGRPSMTWPESVDQALCFGWIDGIRRSIDEQSYSIRFTPRRPDSNWSAVNIAKVKELTRQKLMQPAGIAAFKKRKASRSRIYSYENMPTKLSKDLLQRFKKHKKAYAFFEQQPPSHKKKLIYWIMEAKREETRLRRLDKLIESCKTSQKLF